MPPYKEKFLTLGWKNRISFLLLPQMKTTTLQKQTTVWSKASAGFGPIQRQVPCHRLRLGDLPQRMGNVPCRAQSPYAVRTTNPSKLVQFQSPGASCF